MTDFFYKKGTKKKELNLTRILKVGVFTVVAIWALTFFLLPLYNEPGDAGAIGDMFGMVNALFSALAFAFLIYTALMQSEELRLQREELRNQREEMKLTREVHQKQLETANIQLEAERDFRVKTAFPVVNWEFNIISGYFSPEEKVIKLQWKVTKNQISFFGIQSKLDDEAVKENDEIVDGTTFIANANDSGETHFEIQDNSDNLKLFCCFLDGLGSIYIFHAKIKLKHPSSSPSRYQILNPKIVVEEQQMLQVDSHQEMKSKSEKFFL